MNQPTPGAIDVIVKWLTRYCEVYRKEMTRELFPKRPHARMTCPRRTLDSWFRRGNAADEVLSGPGGSAGLPLCCARKSMPRQLMPTARVKSAVETVGNYRARRLQVCHHLRLSQSKDCVAR